MTGGGTSSGKTWINGTLQPNSGPHSSSYSYSLSNGYVVSGGSTTPSMGGGGTPWLERLGLGTDWKAAFAFGLLQGAANIANGVVGGGDWSRGLFVHESDGAHSLSKNLGGAGASILLMGGLGQATIVAKLGCITNNSAFKAVGVGMGAMGSASELGQFAQAVSNGDGYGAVEHGGLALMGLLDMAAAFGQACFAAGTPILTEDGWKPIEDVRPGDRVLSAPEDDPDVEPTYRVVEETFQRYSPAMEVRVGGRTILTTAEHPFWVQGEGWRQAQQLKAGDLLRTHDGRLLPIEEAGLSREPAPVYNMRVAEYHTYFVGKPEWGFSVWAHNACISRWGRPGLQSGDWVMKGPVNWRNYILTFKWQRGVGNQFAPFSSGREYTVPGSSISWPTGWGVDGWWKGMFGQRRYTGPSLPDPGWGNIGGSL